MDIFFLLLCISLISQQVSAIAFYVKNVEKDVGFCVSNETESENVHANLYDLRSSNDGYGPKIFNKKYQLYRKECFFGSKCTWETVGLNNQNSLSENLILDREWNYLPEARTNGEKDFQHFLDVGNSSETVKFHVSILADTAIFFFAKEIKIISDPGFMLIVDSDSRSLLLKQCKHFFVDFAPDECTDQEKTGVDILHGGSKWVHLTFELTNRNKGFTLSVFNGQDRWTFDKFKNSEDSRSSRHLLIRTNHDTGFFKLHQYPYLESSGDVPGKYLVNYFTLTEDKQICVEVVYEGSWIVSLSKSGKEETRVTLTGRNGWKTKNIEKNLTAGNYTFKVETLVKGSKIRDVKYCSKHDPIRVNVETGNGAKIIGCQSITNDEIIFESDDVPNDIKDLLDERVLKNICSEAGNADCKFVEVCDQSGCFCLSGYVTSGNQKCSEACQVEFFGPNCALKSSADCKDKDKHTGKCSTSQEMTSPEPKTELSEFDLPLVLTVNVHSVKVEISKSLDDLSPSDRIRFKSAEIQTKKADENNNWKNGITLTTEERFGIISGLAQNTEYAIRALISETGPSRSGPETKFTTKRCTPITHETIANASLEHLFEHGTFLNEDKCQISSFSVHLWNGTEISFNTKVALKPSNWDSIRGSKNLTVVFQDESGRKISRIFSNFTLPTKSEDNGSSSDGTFYWVGILLLIVIIAIGAAIIWKVVKTNRRNLSVTYSTRTRRNRRSIWEERPNPADCESEQLSVKS